MNLLGEIVRFADFGDHVELGFQPIDVVLFINEDPVSCTAVAVSIDLFSR